jgi:phosphoribosylformimino-5-aminoimidazole carboxamide ribotide isomerase
MIEVIPAIDIMNGRCIRLEQGEFNRSKTYFDNPVIVAKMFVEKGFKTIHVVDLDGARVGWPQNNHLIKKIINETGLSVQTGGGIRTRDDVDKLLAIGVKNIVVGSLAVKEPRKLFKWLNEIPPETFILAADVKNGIVLTNGWQSVSAFTVKQFIKNYADLGVKSILCTDVSRDGMLDGPAFEIYRDLKQTFPKMRMIASGGVASLQDIRKLDKDGIDAVVVGKAIYEKKVTLEEIVALKNKASC